LKGATIMALVTIVGSIKPCVYVSKGEIRENIMYDDHVQRLIDGGFVEVLEWVDDEPAPAKPPRRPEAQPQATGDDDDGADSAGGGQRDPVGVAAEGSAEGGAVDETSTTPG
jgi:hypothetical protein